MALPTSNISTSSVRSTLGSANNGIWALCNDANINKWSKFKPIVGIWPAGDGSYGLNPASDWNYYTRITGSLGQFAGYEHDPSVASPPIFSKSSENIVSSLYPNVRGQNVDNRWKIRCKKSASSSRLTPADLGIGNFYYGFKVVCPGGGGTFYKTKGQISSLTSDIDTSVDMTITVTVQNPTTTPSFYDFPYGTNGDGSFTWSLIICSSSSPSWSETVPGTVYNLPSSSAHGSEYTGSFTLYNWNYASSNDVGQFDANGSGERSFDVFTNDDLFTISNVPAWITAQVYKNGNYVANPNNYVSDSSVRLTCATNYGSARNGTIFIGTGDASVSITVSQAAAAAGVTYNWVHDEIGSGYNITPISHGMSVGSTNFDLHFSHDFTGDDWKYWAINASPSGANASGSGNPNGVRVRSANQADCYKGGTLSAAIQDGDTVTITIDNVV